MPFGSGTFADSCSRAVRKCWMISNKTDAQQIRCASDGVGGDCPRRTWIDGALGGKGERDGVWGRMGYSPSCIPHRRRPLLLMISDCLAAIRGYGRFVVAFRALAGTIDGMKSLLQSNPYLADPVTRKRMVRHNARQSSVFEGARGIPAQPLRPRRNRCSRASTKKSVKGS